MDEALGKDSVHIQMKVIEENLTIHYTPEAMRQMMNLSVLDQLTSQADRHGNNVFFQYEVDDEKRFYGLQEPAESTMMKPLQKL